MRNAAKSLRQGLEAEEAESRVEAKRAHAAERAKRELSNM